MSHGTAQRLSEMRPDLERKPQARDPFAVNVRAALEALNATWNEVFLIGYVDGLWRACRVDGTGDVLTGLSPDDLAVKMRARWESRAAGGAQ